MAKKFTETAKTEKQKARKKEFNNNSNNNAKKGDKRLKLTKSKTRKETYACGDSKMSISIVSLCACVRACAHVWM